MHTSDAHSAPIPRHNHHQEVMITQPVTMTILASTFIITLLQLTVLLLLLLLVISINWVLTAGGSLWHFRDLTKYTLELSIFL